MPAPSDIQQTIEKRIGYFEHRRRILKDLATDISECLATLRDQASRGNADCVRVMAASEDFSRFCNHLGSWLALEYVSLGREVEFNKNMLRTAQSPIVAPRVGNVQHS